MNKDEAGTGSHSSMSKSADEIRTTIENCEDEPIRIPGSIQRHGFLLLLDERNESVVAASENTEEFLEVPLRLILGTPVETVLEREVLAVVRALVHNSEAAGQITYLGSFPLRQDLYSVVTHLVDGRRVLEFERVDRLVSPELMNAVITNFVGKLSKLGDEMALCRAITTQVKDLTGFNRILLYRFDESGNGTVLTEENDGVLPSYLDLRFPASDIPKQARELYVANTVRIIPNAVYTPSPLKGAASRQMKDFDLSSSILRSVSPIHLEYMKNMGTVASMSISIVFEGRLWGLISCHHAEPRSVPYVVRSACDLLTKMVSTQLLAFRSATELERALHFHSVQRNLLTQMAAEHNYVAALVSRIDELQQVTNANGAALIMDGRCILGGSTPTKTDVIQLTAWMDAQPHSNLYQTSYMQDVCDWAGRIRNEASGFLAVRLSDVRQSYLMWFRPEVVSTVTWAGEPVKLGDQGLGLHPRNSFGAWQERVHGHSVPWTDMEVQSAQEFRTAVMTISLKRAEEAVGLSEARFEQLTHSLPNLIWAAGDDGQLTYVNKRWRQRGLRGSGIWYEQDQLTAQDQDSCRIAWVNAIATETPFEVELRINDGDGDAGQWNLVRALPFQGAGGVRAGWVGTFTDLTERRERELALKMTEKLALTGRMTSFIAHEINNPLEAITNIHYLLSQEVRGNDPAIAYIAMADHELERISGITKQTLRWSKESSQSAEEGIAGALFDDVLRLFAGKIRNRDVTVTVIGREAHFFGVLGQIRQVVVNLFSNALDAVQVGGHVSLSACSREGNTEFVVGDSGPGMNEEIKKLIFQPFFSTKGDLGNGLGLYISQEIVERHGGTLVAESKTGEGAQLKMTLPFKPSDNLLPPLRSGI
ncbi:light-regulated signal transduction histidine kinase (bacteriophytochrome) [Granulicella aggregans]|uniref:histidine kinase n=1 Tax=Granulicella aggregans TaxID=474949 RepID=A0A7W7ZIE2_9BACT|nr:ATP-binding protein [Granulicella aggregans]MBB5060458.1 light-regulated signal transduction histidine kinase (bacteriophytochrome) [Granulicella aggregans]